MSRPRRRPTRPPANAAMHANRRDVVKPDPNEPVLPVGRRTGRPSLLTPEVERMFLNCIRAGSYRTVCARLVGVSEHTVEQWIIRGRGQKKDRPATEPYRRFVRLVEEAEAATEVTVVGNFVKASEKDWRAALAWLRASPERRKRWGEQDDGPFPLGQPSMPPQLPSGGPGAALLGPGTTVHVDARSQMVVLRPDDLPGVVHGLLVQQREERAQRLAAAAHTVLPEPEHGGTRIRSLDGLRVEGDEGDEPDDD